ncbi:hypothetical protein [Pelagicoccus mobilis]|uniref:Uncharacterized protein n=1 Tax=Pelagicoccus mobilis TaxID=415221 RepID=A0A934VQG8_9BACT|nr:hypothetical protein [Pelagicoccus mobilis]MBK1876563.1 hypothetical protein [Pelagicoccus mobilis]
MRLPTPNQPFVTPLLLACLLLSAGNELSAKPKDDAKQFSDYYELEPFQVTGEEIPITVFARNGGDRSYATRFAHKVVEVAYRTLERSPGSGLVIIGRSGEPHPITLFEKFMETAQSDNASPELKAIATELENGFGKWREKIHFEMDEGDDDIPFDVRKLVDAFPIPLPQMAAQLYLLAWERNFDPEQVDTLLAQLKATDLKQQDFEEFTWIFYLPPRNSLNKVLKEVLPLAFEAGDLGPVKRALARAAIAAFKPLIKDAVEGVRKGVLYWSVLTANEAAFNEGDIEALASVYIESQMPKGKVFGSDKTGRGIEAIERQKLKNAEYAKDPFVLPTPLESFDSASFATFEGRYGDEGHRNKTFFSENGSFFWQEGDDDPVEYLPAGESYLVSSQNDVTLRFMPGETPSFFKVELRKGRFRHTFARLPETEVD